MVLLSPFRTRINHISVLSQNIFEIFYVKRHFNLFWLGCVYVSMYARWYVSKYRYLHCQDLRIRYKDFLVIRHSSYTKKDLIYFPKKHPFLSHMVNFSAVCPKVMQPFISWSAVMIFYETLWHDEKQQIDKSNANVRQFSQEILFLS